MPRVEEVPLVERSAERAALAGALDAARGGEGCLLLVEGPAGIGKSRLLEAALEAGEQLEFRTLAARGAELEREYAYGVARGLFERQLVAAGDAERERLLSGSASWCAGALGLAGVPAPAPADAPFAVLNGLYWLAANLAAERPLLLAIDDLHWADQASMRFLAYLAARIEDLPMALVVTARPAEPGVHLIDQLAATRGVRLLRPTALSVDACGRIVADRLGREIDPSLADACHAATRGNPFYLHELASALVEDDAAAHPLGVDRVRELGPETVSRAVLLRVARMPDAAGALAAAVAVLGNDVELRDAASLAGAGVEAASAAVDALVDAEILAPEAPLNFAHPIVRSAVYADLGPGELATAHGEAAALLLSREATPERVASHLLHTAAAGREDFVRALRQAARVAIERGSGDSAVLYLRRALDETSAAGGDLLCELGEAEGASGEDPEAGITHLREAILLLADPKRRAHAWLALARTVASYRTVPEAVEVLEKARDDLSAFDGLEPETQRRVEVELFSLGITHADSFARAAEWIDRRPEPAGDTLGQRLVLCNHAYRVGMRGLELDRTIELCKRAFAGGELAAAEGTASNAVDQALYVLWFADRHEDVRAIIEAYLAYARGRASAWGQVSALAMRSGLHYFDGDMARSEADARQALEVPGFPPFAIFVLGMLAWTLVERGQLDEADSAIERSGCGPDLPPIVHMELLFHIRAALRAAQGRDREALADLLEYGARSERVGAHNPGIPWRADAALAWARLGDDKRAAELAAEHLEIARAWGSASAMGIALRAQGLVLGGEPGLARLAEAVSFLATSPKRLEHARAQVDLGSALRRNGRRRDAREPLRRGMDAARRCGATALVERAHEELRIAGARPRRLQFSGAESLTASERRVAELAAAGLSNREIAESLFVTTKTVENHLSRAYGKLAIGSRRELPDALLGAAP